MPSSTSSHSALVSLPSSSALRGVTVAHADNVRMGPGIRKCRLDSATSVQCGVDVQSNEVRELREALGWSQEKLAHIFGCTVRTLRKYEYDESPILARDLDWLRDQVRALKKAGAQ